VMTTHTVTARAVSSTRNPIGQRVRVTERVGRRAEQVVKNAKGGIKALQRGDECVVIEQR
jgi:hypothetical protein